MKTTVDRTLTQQQWEELRYPVTVQALTEEEGGGYFVTIPLLGEATCAADGETLEEAFSNLESYRRSLYDVVINSKYPIPLPNAVTQKEVKPNGKWLMRASSELHATLQQGAKEAGVSFNTYCVECLSRGHDSCAAQKAVRDEMTALKTELLAEVKASVSSELKAGLQGDLMDEVRAVWENARIEVEPVRPRKGITGTRTIRQKMDYELGLAA